ncbi:uncharacterized protein EV422DRAFT_13940 [Fimicolochytrium jonesii]|uniref:uncharacterized protein n=1 Tax=Fimicolochytrium jonesii TaxID=1396493 RepID=UPI0022FE5526|nr:uncharacterized protein EV422DRAFT_13940 [Fimicolochytrium jonesii]KAI8826845.1 hypothetical protein EV422DRAFT_13940 [Fimicolochytrium jonesii]
MSGDPSQQLASPAGGPGEPKRSTTTDADGTPSPGSKHAASSIESKPALDVPTATNTDGTNGSAPTIKMPIATNKFSNDGSFAERFKLMHAEAEEKRKNEEAVKKKTTWESSFRTRGKRKKGTTTASSEGSAAKKAKEGFPETETTELDEAASAYLKEMARIKEKLPGGDKGSGVRPLVK